MKVTRFSLLVGVLSLASCRSAGTDAPEMPAADGLAGRWRLQQYQCSCPANNTVPNQELVLDARQHFQFFSDGQLAAEGSYTLGTGSACSGGTGAAPLLTLTAATPGTYAPTGNYTLTGNTLIVDGCLAADGPRYTFQRQP